MVSNEVKSTAKKSMVAMDRLPVSDEVTLMANAIGNFAGAGVDLASVYKESLDEEDDGISSDEAELLVSKEEDTPLNEEDAPLAEMSRSARSVAETG